MLRSTLATEHEHLNTQLQELAGLRQELQGLYEKTHAELQVTKSEAALERGLREAATADNVALRKWNAQLGEELSALLGHLQEEEDEVAADSRRGGIFNEEVDFLLERMHDLSPPITFELLNTYFDAAWCAAQVFNGRHDKRMPCDVFSKPRETYFKNEGKFRPNASQMLFVVPVLAHFMQTVADVRMKLPEETASLAALSEVGSQTAEAVHASHKPCWAGVVEH